MTEESRPKVVGGLAVGAALATAFFALTLAGELAGIGPAVAVPLGFAAAAAICARGFFEPRSPAWIALGAAFGCWAIGDLILWVTGTWETGTGYPAGADLIFSGFYIGAAAAVALLMPRRPLTLPLLASGLALATVWSWLIYSSVTGAEDGLIGDVAVLTFPVLDLALLIGVILAIAGDQRRPRRSLVVLALAFLATMVADLLLVLIPGGGPVAAGLRESLWPLAMILAAIAAWTPGRFTTRGFERPGSWLMAGTAVASLGILVFDHYSRVPSWTAILSSFTLLAATVSATRLHGRYREARRVAGAAQEDVILRSQLIDQVDASVVATDRSSRFVFWSAAAERTLGWSREEALGKTALDLRLIDPDDGKRLAGARARARHGETIAVEGKARRADGTTFDALYRLAPLTDTDGEIVGATGVIIDLTEKKEYERSLTARSVQRGAVAELGRRVAVERDVDSLTDFACQTVAKVLEVESVEVLELVHQSELRVRAVTDRRQAGGSVGRRVPLSGSHAGSALQRAEPVCLEELVKETGRSPERLGVQTGVASGVAVAIRSPGEDLGSLAVYASERPDFGTDEMSFLQSVAGVIAAALTRERTDRLTLRLQQSQKQEDMGRLIGGVAHDFNNLLSLILNYVAFARDRLPAGQIREDLDEALTAANSAADLTSRLLLLSRRDERKPRPVDLNESIADMAALLGRTLGEDIALTTRLDPDIAATEVDPSEVHQVLLNLAVNARDVMPDGGRLVIETAGETIESPPEDLPLLTPGDYVRLSVSDSGPGMSEEVRRQAFDPFFTTKAPGEGTGLGLGIVNSIATRAGGGALIHSRSGGGVTVTLLLPACPPAQEGGGSTTGAEPRREGALQHS